jgi:diaminopimelate epimerase
MVVLMDFSFVKMHGAGNDFVLIDDREGTFPVHDYRRVSALATRRSGVGCEGVILVQKSETADFRMRFFNPDGTEADLCGNGARCVAAFAREIGAATADTMRFETAAGEIAAEIVDGSLVKIAMPAPKNFGEDFVVAGVPHKIVPVDNLAKTDVEREGRRIRKSPEYAPEGTNVDFVVYRQPNRVVVRTYERGVEAETGACGTGAVASAVVGVKDYGLEFPVHVQTSQGYDLTVDGVFDGETFSDLTLTGPLRKVFDGRVTWESLDAGVE